MTIKMWMNTENSINFKFTSKRDDLFKLKQIKYIVWNKQTKYWSMPLTLNNYIKFSELYKFGQIINLKHKAIMFLIYSSGLRVGEVVALKVQDIDSERMLVHVKQGKGFKDRYTLLSQTALEALRDYAKKHRLSDWLFPSDDDENHISVRSVQKVFSNICKKAGIQNQPQFIRFAIPLQRICWNRGQIYGIYRNCLGISAVKRQKYIPM